MEGTTVGIFRGSSLWCGVSRREGWSCCVSFSRSAGPARKLRSLCRPTHRTRAWVFACERSASVGGLVLSLALPHLVSCRLTLSLLGSCWLTPKYSLSSEYPLSLKYLLSSEYQLSSEHALSSKCSSSSEYLLSSENPLSSEYVSAEFGI